MAEICGNPSPPSGATQVKPVCSSFSYLVISMLQCSMGWCRIFAIHDFHLSGAASSIRIQGCKGTQAKKLTPDFLLHQKVIGITNC